MEPVKTINYKNYMIKVVPDDNAENPIQNWDMLGEYFCWHKRYNLGNSTRFTTPDELIAYAKETNSLLFPLYMYEHSGIILSLSNSHYPFTDRWDSGQLGFVLVDKEKALKEYGKKRLTEQLKQKIRQVIEGEVKTYNQYLSGDVYGYIIEKNDEEIDSCWGFYGIDYCLNEAKSSVDYSVSKSVKEHCQKLKQWIIGKVPLVYRKSYAI